MAAPCIPVSPSQYFDGNDGPWSTFQIQVDTSDILYNILPATGQSTIWLVYPTGCSNASDESSCQADRGGTFNFSSSSSYTPLFNGEKYLPLSGEAALNGSVSNLFGNAAYVGLDTVSLGSQHNEGGSLPNQVIASYSGLNPFVGQLGLSAYNSNVVSPQYSLLGWLNSTNAVPSAVWAYTAGSSSRNVFGSLTFGGYDPAYGNTNNVLTSPLGLKTYSDLIISVTGIRIGSKSVPVDSPMSFTIDSLIPELWLPDAVCDQFEDAFGLTWNASDHIYTLNSTQAAANRAANTSVTLSLATSGDSSKTIDITMPYSSFDLNAQWPITAENENIPFFPLQRATNSSQWYLGRAFLQDAYLAVDYDRSEFNISQTLHPEQTREIILIPIVNHTVPSSNSSRLTWGAIAGIVIGSLAVVAIVFGAIFWFLRRRRNQRQRQQQDKEAIDQALEDLRPPRSRGTTIVASMEEPPPIEEHFKPFLSELAGTDGQVGQVKVGELHGDQTYELYGDPGRTSELSGSYVSPRIEQLRSPMTTRSESFDTMSPPLSDTTTPPIGSESGTEISSSWFGGPVELPNSPRPRHDRNPSSLSHPSIREEETQESEGPQEQRSSLRERVSPLREHDDFEDDVALRGTRNTLMTPHDLASRLQFDDNSGSWTKTTTERQYSVVNNDGLVPNSPDPATQTFAEGNAGR